MCLQVYYGDEQCVFSPLQINVMLLNKLKDVAEKALDMKVVDCVISVSTSYHVICETIGHRRVRSCRPLHYSLCVIRGISLHCD